MKIAEIKFEDLKLTEFIEEQIKTISSAVGKELPINALSGGVDSSVVTFDTLEQLASRITLEVAGVVSVTYNIANKPPSTIEAV